MSKRRREYESLTRDRQVCIRKLNPPINILECKDRLLRQHGSVVRKYLLNKHGHIDPASLRDFIRKKSIPIQPSSTIFEKCNAILDCLHLQVGED